MKTVIGPFAAALLAAHALSAHAAAPSLATLGNEAMPMKPREFTTFVNQELAEYACIFKAAGIKPQ